MDPHRAVGESLTLYSGDIHKLLNCRFLWLYSQLFVDSHGEWLYGNLITRSGYPYSFYLPVELSNIQPCCGSQHEVTKTFQAKGRVIFFPTIILCDAMTECVTILVMYSVMKHLKEQLSSDGRPRDQILSMRMCGLISVSVRVLDMKKSDNHRMRLYHQQSKCCILKVISIKDWLSSIKASLFCARDHPCNDPTRRNV